jgi:GDPmannose 4,6-dehydratase
MLKCAREATGLWHCVYLGNPNARRDWGHARDYVRAQRLMLQQPEPEDLVIATGQQHSVREFVMHAAGCLGMQIEWRGDGIDETGVDADSGRPIVRVDPRYFRPSEVDSLLGDASKARAKLGWTPEISFAELIAEMVAADVALAARDQLVARGGHKIFRHYE